jgi:hypothetical protein
MTPQQEQQLARDVGDLRVTAGRIEGTLTGIMATQAETKADVAGVEVRVRLLEAWRWRVMGAAAAVGLAASWLYQVVSHR